MNDTILKKMLATYEERFIDLAVGLSCLTQDQVQPHRKRGGRALSNRLVEAGLLSAKDRVTIYHGLRHWLQGQDLHYKDRMRDAILARLAVTEQMVTGQVLSRYLQKAKALEAEGTYVGLTQLLASRGVLLPEQLTQLEGLHATAFHCCCICGENLDRDSLEPDAECLRCGWPPAQLFPESDDVAITLAQDLGEIDPMIGRVLGGCKILRRIGAGGMATVYQALHLKLEMQVAIKILPHQMAGSKEWRERFMREARVAARLEHPAIVGVKNVDCEDSTYFMVMEYVAGESVGEHLRRLQRLPAAEALRIVREAAAGLERAHAAGLIHRDIKPDNLLLTEQGKVKVADFGLAREVAGSTYSVTGQVMGSPGYMSPEQSLGERLDHRTDIFSLGITLYALLSGSSPFQRDNALACVRAIVDDPLPPICRQFPEVPLVVQGLLGRLCAKRPAGRPADMAAVGAALDEVIASLSQPPRPRPVSRRHPPLGHPESAGLPAWAFGVGLGAMALLMLLIWLAMRAETADEPQPEPERRSQAASPPSSTKAPQTRRPVAKAVEQPVGPKAKQPRTVARPPALRPRVWDKTFIQGLKPGKPFRIKYDFSDRRQLEHFLFNPLHNTEHSKGGSFAALGQGAVLELCSGQLIWNLPYARLTRVTYQQWAGRGPGETLLLFSGVSWYLPFLKRGAGRPIRDDCALSDDLGRPDLVAKANCWRDIEKPRLLQVQVRGGRISCAQGQSPQRLQKIYQVAYNRFRPRLGLRWEARHRAAMYLRGVTIEGVAVEREALELFLQRHVQAQRLLARKPAPSALRTLSLGVWTDASSRDRWRLRQGVIEGSGRDSRITPLAGVQSFYFTMRYRDPRLTADRLNPVGRIVFDQQGWSGSYVLPISLREQTLEAWVGQGRLIVMVDGMPLLEENAEPGSAPARGEAITVRLSTSSRVELKDPLLAISAAAWAPLKQP